MQIEVGSVLEGKVTGIAAFGAFVELTGGKTGLVHISEIASEYVSDIKEHLKEGQKVKVKVIAMDKGKISLSIKQVEGNSPKTREDKKSVRKRGNVKRTGSEGFHQPPEEFDFSRRRGSDMSFDDMLQKFKQDSDEKFQDLKRSNEGKRSGGYKRTY